MVSYSWGCSLQPSDVSTGRSRPNHSTGNRTICIDSEGEKGGERSSSPKSFTIGQVATDDVPSARTPHKIREVITIFHEVDLTREQIFEKQNVLKVGVALAAN